MNDLPEELLIEVQKELKEALVHEVLAKVMAVVNQLCPYLADRFNEQLRKIFYEQVS